MSYSPASNEYPIQPGVVVGYGPTTASFLRVYAPYTIPGVIITINAQLLDINGNIISGPKTSYSYNGSLSTQPELNNSLKGIVSASAALNGITLS